jgi:hypothetical protein
VLQLAGKPSLNPSQREGLIRFPSLWEGLGEGEYFNYVTHNYINLDNCVAI